MAKLLGKIGGQATLKRHGTDHFKLMRKLSGEAKKRKKEAHSILVLDKG